MRPVAGRSSRAQFDAMSDIDNTTRRPGPWDLPPEQAQALADTARAVESAAREHLPGPAEVTPFLLELDAVLAALNSLSAQEPAPAPAAQPLDTIQALQDLLHSLRQDDALSLDLVRALQQSTQTSPHAMAMAELVHLVEEVEYDAAITRAQLLLQKLLVEGAAR